MIGMRGAPLVEGDAEGPALFLDEPLSFWGGVKIETGEILDRHHPQFGKAISGTFWSWQKAAVRHPHRRCSLR